MKKLILFLSAALLISLMGYTQKISEDMVPVAVKQAFKKKFPAVTEVKYEMEKKDYEVNFKDKGVEMSANFDVTGKWLETETKIKESDLPMDVSASVGKNFAGFKILEVTKVETSDKGLCFGIDLKKRKEKYEVLFSKEGVMLMKNPLGKKKD